MRCSLETANEGTCKRTSGTDLQDLPNAVEVPWPRLKVIGYGIGPKKSTEHFCYIGLYDGHINLGFNYGLALPDPDQLAGG